MVDAHRIVFVVALLVAPALAGCATLGADEKGEAVNAQATPQAPLVEAPKPGALRGLVIAPGFEPVKGATVSLLRVNRTTTTDARGVFFFTDVPEGRHLLHAEAVGFTPKTVAAVVERNLVFVINLTLIPLPVVKPRQETFELEGFIACQGIVQTPGDGGHAARRKPTECGSADANAKTVWELMVEREASGAVLEAVWEAQSPLVSHLDLTVETVDYGDQNRELGYSHADRGYGRIEIPSTAFEQFYPEGGALRVRVNVGPSALDDEAQANVGLAVQQKVTLYLTVFYAQKIPSGFTVIKE